MLYKPYSLFKTITKAALLLAIFAVLAMLSPTVGDAAGFECRIVSDEILEKEYMDRLAYELSLLQSSDSVEDHFRNVNISIVVCDYLVIFELTPRDGVFGVADAIVFSKHNFQLLGSAQIHP